MFPCNNGTPSGSAEESVTTSSGNKQENEWSKSEFRAHSDSIWGLTWAHPEFGSVIASCSEDRTICIWEEKEVLTQPVAAVEKAEKWIKRATLTESKKAVTDVKFAPRFLGFLLASTSADGCVRIYEAPDAFSLNYWQLHDTLMVERIVTEGSSRGANISSEMNDISSSGSSSAAGGVVRESEYGLTCIAWNESPVEAARVAVGGYSKVVSIWVQDSKTNKWREEIVFDKLTGVPHDVAWAPAMGRSYHQIATASRESIVRVFNVSRREDGLLEYIPSPSNPVLLHCDNPVWRIAWNSTGTVLTASGDDGSLRSFKKDFSGSFKLIQSNKIHL